MSRRSLLIALAALGLTQCNKGEKKVTEDPTTRVAKWHFVRQNQPAGDTTFTAVYGNSLNELFAVGWGGVILTNSDGTWRAMSSPTKVNLTAITGVENGAVFGVPAAHGEMVAVGWHGTVLHYHPNPDADPLTDDGTWTVIASAADPVSGQLAASADQTLPYFTPLLRPDPACPDFDGDGRADDGDNDNWIGNVQGLQHICAGGAKTNCDDNCRGTANGNERPLTDATGTGCVGPGSVPDLTRDQVDGDSDGVGLVCDDDDFTPSYTPRFTGTLFTVWMRNNGNNLHILAAGEAGALVEFQGVSAGAMAGAMNPSVTTTTAWEAQDTLGFRFVDDCPAGTPAGQTCNNGRLPPSCPAQCSPLKTTCSCPVGQGQCCDPTASTGASGPNGPAPNACDGATGTCSLLCPECFRRLDETLRSLTVDNTTVVAVGSRGTIVYGDLTDVNTTWHAPSCPDPPKPYDEKPVLAAVRAAGGAFSIIGAAGSVFRAADGGGCDITSRPGAPKSFLSALFPTGGDSSFFVGDEGVFVQQQGGNLTVIPSSTSQNLFAIWRTFAPLTDEELISIGQRPEDLDPTVPRPDVTRYWLLGAGGTIVQASFY